MPVGAGEGGGVEVGARHIMFISECVRVSAKGMLTGAWPPKEDGASHSGPTPVGSR